MRGLIKNFDLAVWTLKSRRKERFLVFLLLSMTYCLVSLQKKWYLDVENTPCAREALIHGIAGGLAVGVLYFMKSSEYSCSCMCIV